MGSKLAFFLHHAAGCCLRGIHQRCTAHFKNNFVKWHHWRSPQSRGPPNAAAVKQTFSLQPLIVQTPKNSYNMCFHFGIGVLTELGTKRKRGILLLSSAQQHSAKGNQRQMARKNNKWRRRESIETGDSFLDSR